MRIVMTWYAFEAAEKAKWNQNGKCMVHVHKNEWKSFSWKFWEGGLS